MTGSLGWQQFLKCPSLHVEASGQSTQLSSSFDMRTVLQAACCMRLQEGQGQAPLAQQGQAQPQGSLQVAFRLPSTPQVSLLCCLLGAALLGEPSGAW